MLFLFCVFIQLLQYTSSWHLKIDYNERSNIGEPIDKLDIAFVNISQNTIGRDYERNAHVNSEIQTKKWFNSNIDEFKNNYLIFNGNNLDQNKLPKVIDKGSFNEAKINLDNFVMSKRSSFISTPTFDFPKKNLHINENIPKNSNELTKDMKFNNNVLTKRYLGDDKFDRNNQLFRILERQNALIEKIVKTFPMKEIQRYGSLEKTQGEFQEILNSIEAKFNVTTTVSTTTIETSTILTMIDETEVREALKNDPFVKRILKLAKMKNVEYKKQFG